MEPIENKRKFVLDMALGRWIDSGEEMAAGPIAVEYYS